MGAGEVSINPHWIQKIQMASSFQRSGRQSECSSLSDPEQYKKYEMQGAIFFREHGEYCSWFSDEFERCLFEEAILWGCLEPEV